MSMHSNGGGEIQDVGRCDNEEGGRQTAREVRGVSRYTYHDERVADGRNCVEGRGLEYERKVAEYAA